MKEETWDSIEISDLSSSLASMNKIDCTHQDKCQGIDSGLKDVNEVSSDDANATQLGVDGRHEDAEHPPSVQLLQCGN